MISFLKNRVALSGLAICVLFAAAWCTTQADDKPAKTPTTHYVDRDKHVALDVPLSWERKFSDDAATRFIFVTGGKSSPNAQPPEFVLVTTGPDAKDDSLKTLAAFAAAIKKQAAAGASDAKFDKDKELKLDGESAISFTGSKTGKAGAAKIIYVVAIHDGTGYSISFACDPATFDAEYAGVQPVIESIKWGK